MDVLARRTRLAFLNAYSALDALPRVIEIMKDELGWTKQRQVLFVITIVFQVRTGI